MGDGRELRERPFKQAVALVVAAEHLPVAEARRVGPCPPP